MATTSDLVMKKVAVKENNKFNTFFKFLTQEESSNYILVEWMYIVER